MTSNKRRPGTQGLEVGAIGLGCLRVSRSGGPASEAASIAPIAR